MLPLLTEVSVVVWFTETLVPRLVTPTTVETLERTGENLADTGDS